MKWKPVVRNGHRCGEQEYRCKDCGKTFVSTTNTLMVNSHQPCESWEAIIDSEIRHRMVSVAALKVRKNGHGKDGYKRRYFLLNLYFCLIRICMIKEKNCIYCSRRQLIALGKLCILNISVLAERVVLHLRYIKSMGKLSARKDILTGMTR